MSSRFVSENFVINEELLQRLASRSSEDHFFTKSLSFYNQVRRRDVTTLSEKQLNWLWELECVLHDRAQNEEVAVKANAADKVVKPNHEPGNSGNLLNKLRAFLKLGWIKNGFK